MLVKRANKYATNQRMVQVGHPLTEAMHRMCPFALHLLTLPASWQHQPHPRRERGQERRDEVLSVW